MIMKCKLAHLLVFLSLCTPFLMADNVTLEAESKDSKEVHVTYDKLVEELKHVHRLKSILNLLTWDERVNMPDQSADFRALQQGTLARLVYREFTKQEIGGYLNVLESNGDQLSSAQRALIRETRRKYDRKKSLSEEFVARKKEMESKGYQAWKKARDENDFMLFAPVLEEILVMAREEAGHVGYADDPYAYWVDRYDPGFSVKDIDQYFGELKSGIAPIVAQIQASSVKPSRDILKGFSVKKQKVFITEVISRIGFDFEQGRLDKTIHPFCGGSSEDCRITVNYAKDAPLFSVFGGLHEAGHGLYEQGQPEQYLGTPLGEALVMAMHESQSRLWENQIGHSRVFWEYWEGEYRRLFYRQLRDISSEDFYRAINAVEVNPVRVQSDEVTYNLHVILRYELEKKLLDGSLQVRDLPVAWNKLSEELLGYTPKNDMEGVLQDVHWSIGAFGYFPSYALGNMIAAQLWAQLRQDIPNVDEEIALGNFAPVLVWLRENIHQYGKQYSTKELVKMATGKEMSSQYFLEYLSERYLPLYVGDGEEG
ncbi:MAG: carboxypeptidase [Verrucomicrobia bacterium CG_4_10_14_0_8_um_filter_43_34]|nr:MAG: carboxypeptidase [Verrucomicrobia bacterium CG22_combo_CG10-13_8_21_14_all_43_17]PIY61505.1 MAG: carboxypeptidase [Verrucomicrobia bacterium CG_4_10_14_0_8_um_filter_43_34]